MLRAKPEADYWDFSAVLVLISYAFLQIARWSLLPYHMDIHYHLHTAWGFIAANGYSGWDFWEFAPLGRLHIYPPLVHILLAILRKLGIDSVFLAKFFQIVIPILFLFTLWYVIRKNYNKRLGLFVLIALNSSYSFYLSLINHIPATLAMVFGLLAFDQLLKNKLLRSALLLTLCFYTHIGVSWLFAIALLLYGLLNRKYLKWVVAIILLALILSVPIVWKQLAGARIMSASMVKERYSCEFKTIDYILALLGLIVTLRKPARYRLFASLFLGSFIFLTYPYRFFSAEGYLPIIFLSAVSLDWFYEKIKERNSILRLSFAMLMISIFFISPTVLMEKEEEGKALRYKLYFFDSALLDLMLPDNNPRIASSVLWFPKEFLSAADLIKRNSFQDDIIFCRLPNVSVTLGSISGRACANGLFPEIVPAREVDYISVSKIILAFKDDDPALLQNLIKRYKLIEIGDNKIFIVFKNPACFNKIEKRKSSLSFAAILFIACLFTIIFWESDRLENLTLRRLKSKNYLNS